MDETRRRGRFRRYPSVEHVTSVDETHRDLEASHSSRFTRSRVNAPRNRHHYHERSNSCQGYRPRDNSENAYNVNANAARQPRSIQSGNRGNQRANRTDSHFGRSAVRDRPDDSQHNLPGNFARPPTKRRYPMGRRELEALHIKSANEILLLIDSEGSGFKLVLVSDDMDKDKLVSCLHVISKACHSDLKEHLSHFLEHLLKECNQFLYVKLVQYLVETQNRIANAYQRASMFYILDLIECFQKIHPNGSLFVTQILLPHIKETIEHLNHNLGNDEELNKRLEIIIATRDRFKDRFTTVSGLKSKEQMIEDAPDDFREIPIFPDKEDLIINKRPFLRPNIIDGRYQNVDHYLDIQFRLLREDFVGPLREGITSYLAQIKSTQKKRFQDIKVYQDVLMTKAILSENGIAHEVSFNVKVLRNVQWEKSKRLIYGSLVCLTRDNFETVYFGTIFDRKPEKLKKGIVCVKLENPDSILDVQQEAFIMIESEAYFEASRHVLSALQNIKEDEFPLKEHIVNLEKIIEHPKYITKQSAYCFKGLFSVSGANNYKATSKTFTLGNPCSCDMYSRKIPVSVTVEQSWPTPDDLALDASQHQALQMALTRKLCIIQGPPGTGKTHVGLKIMQALLHNESHWNASKEERNPILVVCFTNHALDQFLEGVLNLKLTDKIIRMGGRSGSETLKPYNMNSLKRTYLRSLGKNQQMGKLFRELKSKVASLLQEVQSKERGLKRCQNHVMSEVELRFSMFGNQYDSFLRDAPPFLRLTKKDVGKLMVYWLAMEIPSHVGYLPNENALLVGVESYGENPYSEDDFYRENDERQIDNGNHPNNTIESENNDSDDDFVSADEAENDEYDPVDVQYIMDQRMEDDLDELFDNPTQKSREYGNASVINIERDELEIEENEGEWKTQGGSKQLGRFITSQLKKSPSFSEQGLQHCRNVWQLAMFDRWRLYKTWLERHMADTQNEIAEIKEEYEKSLSLLDEVKLEEDVAVAKTALVIGMTTTGAAKYRHLVRNIRSKIVIVEEAAEVLEAHIVTALSPHTEHLILIGDHQQLRPNPVSYDLAKKYNLEISLFERLLKNGIPFVKLQIQHRMKPCISKLISNYIYDRQLLDHDSVSEYEEIKGFSKSMFFVSHQHLELKENDSTSRTNIHEAQFLVSLCHYILQQGYDPSKITILTTYIGQLFTLKKLMTGSLKEVRATVVDNFQGEENDIILISFVRSNEEGVIGFLQTANRVCVALSRARKGLFCIGNFDLLAHKSDLWRNITNDLSQTASIGAALNLQCLVHNNSTKVSSAFDFAKIPDGGCPEPCDFRLRCGHVCEKKCHPLQRDHKEMLCEKPCERIICPLNHKCRKLCHEACGQCTVMVVKVIPKCGHDQPMRCHMDVNSVICRIPCPKTLSCEHKCQKQCGEICGDCHASIQVLGPCKHVVKIPCLDSNDLIKLKGACRSRCSLYLPCGHKCEKYCAEQCETRCKVTVKVLLPCGHSIETDCHKSSGVKALQDACTEPCNASLNCDHICSGSCGKCFQGRLHVPCRQKCEKLLVCGHVCKSPCSNNCPPCLEKCQNRCVHSRCPQICGYPCVPCKEKCLWGCKHMACTNACGMMCNSAPCNNACNRKLKCHPNHKCVGICGEPCPKICRICDKDKLEAIFFGEEDDPQARFIELPDCKHVFEINGLTRWFENETSSQDEVKMLTCPMCKTPVRRNLRFGNHVKEALRKIEQVKEKFYGQIDQNERKQEELKLRASKFKNELARYYAADGFYSNIDIELSYDVVLDQGSLVVIENLFNLFTLLYDVFKRMDNKSRDWTLNPSLAIYVRNCLDYMSTSKSKIMAASYWPERRNTQLVSDINMEITRFQVLVNFIEDFGAICTSGTQQAKDGFEVVMNKVLSRAPFTEKGHSEMRSMKEKLRKLSNGVVIGVSHEEKIQILQAMGLKQGHWYTCPNGHVYCITECGGAMEESRCNECNAPIGGSSHRIRTDNRVATGMDGARHSVWSEQTNLANYEI